MKLEGIRVLDLSRFLPGPMLTQHMADHGAEVIKVEDTDEGEPTRVIGEMRDGVSVFFANTSRGKKSLALNLKHKDGVEAFLRLTETADVVVEAFRPGVAARLGVGYAQVAARAPRVVYVAISAFGQTGPYRDIATHDLATEAMAGTLSITHGRDGAPAIPGLPAGDMLSSALALSGVLMALLRRERTGRGDFLDIAMADSLLASMPNTMGSAMAERRQQIPAESRSLGGHALYALYETADGGWIALGALEMKFAVSILTMLGRPDLIDLCRLPPGRGHDPVREFLKSMFLTRPRDAWIAFFTGHDVPIAPVKTLPEVLDDAHFRARGMVTTNANGWDQIGSPICFTDEPGMPSERLPHHGEHTREILQNIGYGSAEIARLEAGGAVRCVVAKG